MHITAAFAVAAAVTCMDSGLPVPGTSLCSIPHLRRSAGVLRRGAGAGREGAGAGPHKRPAAGQHEILSPKGAAYRGRQGGVVVGLHTVTLLSSTSVLPNIEEEQELRRCR